MRLRSTAPPTVLVTVSPMRALAASRSAPSRRRDCSVKVSTDMRLPARDALKFGPLGQPARRFAGGLRPSILVQGVEAPFRDVFSMRRKGKGGRGRRAVRSGGELLAAEGAARVQHLAAAGRRHAGAKPVTALAHELAGLIGPLHVQISNLARAQNRGMGSISTRKADLRRNSRKGAASRQKSTRRSRAASSGGLCRAGPRKSIRTLLHAPCARPLAIGIVLSIPGSRR